MRMHSHSRKEPGDLARAKLKKVSFRAVIPFPGSIFGLKMLKNVRKNKGNKNLKKLSGPLKIIISRLFRKIFGLRPEKLRGERILLYFFGHGLS